MYLSHLCSMCIVYRFKNNIYAHCTLNEEDFIRMQIAKLDKATFHLITSLFGPHVISSCFFLNQQVRIMN